MSEETKTIERVRMSILSGPCGYAIAMSSKEGNGGTTIAGKVDGFGANKIGSFVVDVERLQEVIRTKSFEETEIWVCDPA